MSDTPHKWANRIYEHSEDNEVKAQVKKAKTSSVEGDTEKIVKKILEL